MDGSDTRFEQWKTTRRAQRLGAVALVGFLVVFPAWALREFNGSVLPGGGDDRWYAACLADSVTQARQGVFPIWVGQSLYQFNGSVSPVRIAPAFDYLAIALDIVTLRSLGPVPLLCLLIVIVGIATLTSAYLCLSSLAGGRRMLGLFLAGIFFSSPGVLGLACNADLIMSWTALPLIPIIFYATVRSFEPQFERRSLLMLSFSLGLCWWCHPPIALWGTLFAFIGQLARIVFSTRFGTDWKAITSAIVIYAMIALYPVGSVLLFPTQPGMNMASTQIASPRVIARFISESFPGSFLPMSEGGRETSDFQLGYTLWLLLCYCLFIRLRRASLAGRVLLCIAGLVVIVAVPIPYLNPLAWKIVPAFIAGPTGNWAVPRLFLYLAGAIAFAVAVSESEDAPGGTRKKLLLAILSAGFLWNCVEANHYGSMALIVANDQATRVDALLPENLKITRYSYGMFPRLPSTFTHGVVNPELENRLLDVGSHTVLESNLDQALVTSHPAAQERLVNHLKLNGTIEIEHPLKLQPNSHYLLQVHFSTPQSARGVLEFAGESFFRTYSLPDYGEARSFGAGGLHRNVVPVWTTSKRAEEISVRFVPAGDMSEDELTQFECELRLYAYERDALPVRVDRWVPYSARVQSPHEAWLESPRMYQPGYVGIVNGRRSKVEKSEDGFVSVRVPAGLSTVSIEYHPPLGLVWLFWISTVSSCAFAASALALYLFPSTRRRWGFV